jgi:hypothetical protein
LFILDLYPEQLAGAGLLRSAPEEYARGKKQVGFIRYGNIITETTNILQ